MGLCGYEWALWLSKCVPFGSKKASLEQHMGFCGPESALRLPKDGI